MQKIADFGWRYCAWNTLAAESRMSIDRAKSVEIDVRVVNLDGFLHEHNIRPEFSKIDTENYEGAVVSGHVDTLTEFHPCVQLEAGSESSLEAADIVFSRI